MGIGYKGKTLKETLEERDRIYQETGRLFGLTKLQLHEEDPAKAMRFQLRLTNACISARETAKLIAASPVARSFGECLFMLLLPEGDCVTASLGLSGHVACTRVTIGNMVKDGFEENPGIKPGDIFANNDPYYGAVHSADNYTFIPIFHKGELIAWACGLNHIADVGAALAAGSTPTSATTHYTDGFCYPPLKVGENFETYSWWYSFWERLTRLPGMNILDDKMRVTGAKMVHDKVLEVVEEFGVDYFRQGIREILERERLRLEDYYRQRTIPGRHEVLALTTVRYKGTLGPLFPYAERDWLVAEFAEVRVLPEGRAIMDTEGTISQDFFHINCYEGTLRMGYSFWWIPHAAYHSTLNSAMDYLIETRNPSGSLLNPSPDHKGAISLGVATAARLGGAYQHLFSKLYYCRGILEEACPESCTNGLVGIEGIFDNGVAWGFSDFSYSGGISTAARPYKDGDEASTCLFNPQSDYGEYEEWEVYMPPVVLLGKRVMPNSCGHGKFRGAMAGESVFWVNNPGKSFSHNNSCTIAAETTAAGSGNGGGYPGLGGGEVVLRGTNIRELMEAGKGYPTCLQEIREWMQEGKLKVDRVEYFGYDTPSTFLGDGDLFAVTAGSQGGWGDPLERKLELVEKDLNNGFMTPDVSKMVYGVVAQLIDGRWKADVEASAKAREEARQRRKQRAVSAKEWWRQGRQLVLDKGFSEVVYNMYADVLKHEKFRGKFSSMWQLPEDYQL